MRDTLWGKMQTFISTLVVWNRRMFKKISFIFNSIFKNNKEEWQ